MLKYLQSNLKCLKVFLNRLICNKVVVWGQITFVNYIIIVWKCLFLF